ncbi:energy transducer TonB [Altererythrobacter aerius]|uniref:Energy transducer TonB n=2 Tax=Tsuneonella aeria TaxID=1837929 RepID=A0A6I4T8Q7_9SPHN|nr:energy transducer TonB [Tsuneonella aeria]MXO73939.1 energy transducer TonB [Tsuneonella aeria]
MVSAGAAAGVTALVVALLVHGFGVEHRAQPVPALVSVAFSETPPPPRPRQRAEQRRARKPAPRDDAGVRNLRNRATPVVAPPVTPLIVPPPIVAATEADAGSAAQTGAADLPGPGRGAGLHGDGPGGGGTGGDGDGTGDGEPVRGPRRISGRLSFADLPDGVLSEGQEAAVTVIFAVGPGGRVSGCRADESSGMVPLDSLTCRLIEQRFRYRPATDRNGRPVGAMVRETHWWIARPE